MDNSFIHSNITINNRKHKIFSNKFCYLWAEVTFIFAKFIDINIFK